MSRVLFTLLVVFAPGFVRAEPTATTNGALGLGRMSAAEVGPQGRLRVLEHRAAVDPDRSSCSRHSC
jgi:hypothetical protein